ncbi:MAG: hypothetical protein HW416_2457 [Chloroflexi bacterium]|nr:hypothetical protein [Chloroflexota bacterium]
MAVRKTAITGPSYLRENLGLSRERMARLLDVSAKSVERWEEQGALPTNPFVRQRLAKIEEITHLGLIVYTQDGLRRFLATPMAEFEGLSALQLVQIGHADRVLAALAADYEGLGA